jgi:type I restriction enzyme S subunit
MISQWQTAKLGDLVSFRTGKLDSNAAVTDGEYPFFTCSQETLRTNTSSFDTECVLLAGNNANGIFPLKYFQGRFDAYQRTYVITARDTNRLTNRFLYYALHPKLAEFRSISTGAATKFLTLSILNETRISLPPAPVQRRIASILGAYDDLIQVNRRRIALLEEMARRLFEECFVRFRFLGHEGQAMVQTQQGPLPEGWTTSKIGDAFEITGGGTPSKAEPRYWEGGLINWYTPSDLTGAKTTFMDSSSLQITEEGLRRSSAQMFPRFSVMMTSRATIGAISINTTEATTNQGFITCIPNDRVPLCFLLQWLRANLPLFVSHATGSTFKEITKGVFRQLTITLPPPGIVSAYEDRSRPILDMILNLERARRQLASSRDLLLPRLISGELSVTSVERELEAVA